MTWTDLDRPVEKSMGLSRLGHEWRAITRKRLVTPLKKTLECDVLHASGTVWRAMYKI